VGEDDSSFAIKRWSDVRALGSVLLMGLAGIAWGLKLEARVDAVIARDEVRDTRIEATDARIAQGI